MEYNKYEEARIIGSRALQISQGAPLLIKFSEKDLENVRYSPLEIAKKEYKEGLIPITVREDHKKEAK
jgi:DNA-directed RNA polymerase subunit K|tara:strand:- start:1706 stop:1909 length:204 start_codon:yes stop_codon:yes gene_type:complete